MMLLLVCGLSSRLNAQSQENISKQIWIDVNPSYYINPHFILYGDVGARSEIENDGWWRLVVRPSIRTWLGGRFYFTAGLGNFVTFNRKIENRWELRPFQGLRVTWPHWKTPLRHYIRLEERFDFNTETWNSKNSIRLRYQLNFSYRWAALQPGRWWQATATAEAFATILGTQGQFQEQSRVTLGLDRSYARDFHYRIEVTWQQERLFYSTSKNVSAIYFRFRMTRSWGNRE